MNTNDTVYVTYTAYEKGTTNVISEGTLPFQGMTCWNAEQTVKTMFNSLEVCIRYSNIGRP